MINDFQKRLGVNRVLLLIAVIVIAVQFIVFKIYYPYANFINGDSYHYLLAAMWNPPVNKYPLGYSLFLRLFSVFTNSDTVLVAFQYLFVEFSALFYLFTLIRFYKPGKLVKGILCCFLLVNPIFLYISNYVSSDAVFLGLSFIWLSLLLWIIHRPSTKIIIIHAIVLLLAFMVRYNAMIYPLISALAFLLSPDLSLRRKLSGITAGFLVVGVFVAHTAYEYKLYTGVWQFSPFSGWQMANNAMYAYRYVDSANRQPVPEKFRKLDNMVRNYFDSTKDLRKYPLEALVANTAYMWSLNSPLALYRKEEFGKDSKGEFRHWASMGPFYADYGQYIIRHYPHEYATYFLWPNFNKYFTPPVEFLGKYNNGEDTVADIAQVWFAYKTNKLKTAFNDSRVTTLDYYPILSGAMDFVFFAGLVLFYLLKGFRYSPVFSKGVLLVGMLWVLNLVFSVFASPVALRFQSFPILVISCFVLLLVEKNIAQ